MIHPDTRLGHASDAIGLGVFATRHISKGTIVWALDDLDQRLSPVRVRRLGSRYQALLDRYAFFNAEGERVVCWDIARFVNHHCEANAISTGWHFDIAVRDIDAGEEICNDYGALNLEETFECACGSAVCRGHIHPEDFDRYSDTWDVQVRGAFPQVTRVPQPLWDFVSPKRLVVAAARDPRRAPSIRRHRMVSPPPLTAPPVTARPRPSAARS
ncbi:MAG TPA: SET domain-containing protein [Myxococcota bacterium]|nr:SET domain-containing protein [Myxococcota bacterium]